MKKAKWLSEEALQIAEKRREVKGKGEKERYIHLNTEFCRGPAPVDPGNSKQGWRRRGSGNNCLIKR